MLFNSFDFVVFFPIVVGLYFALPHRWRGWMLLVASYIFYGWWRAEYLVLILISTVVDYWAGLQMGRHETQRARRPYLFLSLTANLGLLFAFKYLGFFVDSANAFASLIGADGRLNLPALVLPVGISFYTFQTLAYSIDVYRGKQEAERHLGLFALYVSFFPQLVAGPIERSQNLLPQFRERHAFDYDRVVSGLRLMLGGFLMKLVVADRLAPFVQEVFSQPGAYHGLPVLLAFYFFTFQIYCDFAGYSLIAIGSARVMGYDLMENFRRPFFSKSIGEFWQRWHISLSTWFRDYLYIPLGGNRVPRWRWYLNLLVVFTVSGLWHGANWTFVIWGALHGVYLVAGALTASRREGVWATWEDRYRLWQGRDSAVRAAGLVAGTLAPRTLRRWGSVLLTFHLFAFSMVIFRSATIGEAPVFFRSALQMGQSNLPAFIMAVSPYDFLLAVLAVAGLVACELAQRKRVLNRWLGKQPFLFRWAVYVGALAVLWLFGVYSEQAFIYFQF
jgi:D-alanyl-lipoteichoic acid acyltransferase DltB (MBOAT superfamily)